MNITEAKKLAKDAAIKNRIFGWKIFFSDSNKMCGLCWYTFKTLEFSKPHFDINSPDVCRDTILHEIAHAIVGYNHDHDEVWKNKCREIGAIPEEFIDTTNRVVNLAWQPEDAFEDFRITNYLDHQYKCRVDKFETIKVEDQKLLGDGK